MQAQCTMAMSDCPSVCYKPYLYQNGWIDWSHFWHGVYPLLTDILLEENLTASKKSTSLLIFVQNSGLIQILPWHIDYYECRQLSPADDCCHFIIVSSLVPFSLVWYSLKPGFSEVICLLEEVVFRPHWNCHLEHPSLCTAWWVWHSMSHCLSVIATAFVLQHYNIPLHFL